MRRLQLQPHRAAEKFIARPQKALRVEVEVYIGRQEGAPTSPRPSADDGGRLPRTSSDRPPSTTRARSSPLLRVSPSGEVDAVYVVYSRLQVARWPEADVWCSCCRSIAEDGGRLARDRRLRFHPRAGRPESILEDLLPRYSSFQFFQACSGERGQRARRAHGRDEERHRQRRRNDRPPHAAATTARARRRSPPS